MEKDNFTESQSLSSQDETDTVVKEYYSALDVADAFVKQYYNILQTYPKDAHNFYKDQSVRSHPSVDGLMKTVTTLNDIDDAIMALNIKEWNPDMSTMYAQDSVMESVIVGVTGSLIDNDDVSRNFAQTFFLAPQEGGGFYVHNDFLQFIEIKNEKVSETSPTLDDGADSLAAQQANDTAKDSTLEKAQAANGDQIEKSGDTETKVSASLEGQNPIPTEPKKKCQSSVSQSATNIQEDSKKMSYASILAKEGSGPSTTQSSSDTVAKVTPNTDNHTSTSSVVAKPSTISVKSSMIPNNSAFENIYDVKAIRVKDLPPKLTEESLLEVVKQFGPVKLKNIQIKEYPEDGYRYAFVEFDNPKSARNAIEARFIQFEDRESEIQYKKHPNQGRSPFGRGGFRNNSFWGRDGEGRSSNINSWGNKRVDHDNFGQHSGQTRDYNTRRNRYFQDRQ